jgi:hypothetical protein
MTSYNAEKASKARQGITAESRKKQGQSHTQNAMIKNIVNEAIKEMLLDDTKKGTPQYKQFLDAYIKTAITDPNSQAAGFFADRIIAKDLLTVLDTQHEKELARDLDFTRYRILNQFYDRQREVMQEINHRKRIMCLTSRRTGKSTMAAGIIDLVSVKKESDIIYFNRTFANGIKQVFDNVIKYADSVDLKITEKKKSDGYIKFANGSSLQIFGNSNNAEADKARGYKARCVIIDEVGHQRNLDYLLNEVIYPLMADYEDSTLLLLGTPSRIPHHFSTKIWESDSSFRKYNWSMIENPYIPKAREFIDEICKAKGLSIESPFIQREYFGKIAPDTEAIIFKKRTYLKSDTIAKIKSGEIKITDIVIGVDYGFSDFNSMITLAYNRHEKTSFVIEESKFNRATVSEIIERVKEHHANAKEILEGLRINPEDHLKIYADTNEESITADLMVKHKLPAYNCYKYDKMFAIEMLADELRAGRMTIPKGGVLDSEMERTLYARNDEDDIINEIDETAFHADAIMALLYASRKAFFDMDYDINFKESQPKTSDYITDSNGTIVDVNLSNDSGNFEDSGIVG